MSERKEYIYKFITILSFVILDIIMFFTIPTNVDNFLLMKGKIVKTNTYDKDIKIKGEVYYKGEMINSKSLNFYIKDNEIWQKLQDNTEDSVNIWYKYDMIGANQVKTKAPTIEIYQIMLGRDILLKYSYIKSLLSIFILTNSIPLIIWLLVCLTDRKKK